MTQMLTPNDVISIQFLPLKTGTSLFNFWRNLVVRVNITLCCPILLLTLPYWDMGESFWKFQQRWKKERNRLTKWAFLFPCSAVAILLFQYSACDWTGLIFECVNFCMNASSSNYAKFRLRRFVDSESGSTRPINIYAVKVEKIFLMRMNCVCYKNELEPAWHQSCLWCFQSESQKRLGLPCSAPPVQTCSDQLRISACWWPLVSLMRWLTISEFRSKARCWWEDEFEGENLEDLEFNVNAINLRSNGQEHFFKWKL